MLFVQWIVYMPTLVQNVVCFVIDTEKKIPGFTLQKFLEEIRFSTRVA